MSDSIKQIQSSIDQLDSRLDETDRLILEVRSLYKKQEVDLRRIYNKLEDIDKRVRNL